MARAEGLTLALGVSSVLALGPGCGAEQGEAAAPGDVGAELADVGADGDGVDADGDAVGEPGPARSCNGHTALCDTPIDRLVLPGTHNSMSAREEDFFAPNQEYGIARQLADGIRGFLIDTYEVAGEYLLCHASCRIGSTPAVEGLGVIAEFLEAHPDEFVAIIFQNGISPAQSAELAELSGLAAMAFTPPEPGEAWPTLAAALDAGQRVLMTLESGSADEPWLPNAWSVFFDTPYTFASQEAFDCSVNRGRSSNALYLVNHWIQDPITRPDLAERANAREVLLARVAACTVETGRQPNVLAVDFYDRGDLFEVVAELNAGIPFADRH